MLYIEIKPYGVIYLLKNKINGKIYIGQTIDFNRRMNEHKNRKPSLSKKYNYHITKIINNYGFNNFSSEIIDVAYSKKDLDKNEKYYKFYDLIRKGVEAIEKLYTIEYIEYN